MGHHPNTKTVKVSEALHKRLTELRAELAHRGQEALPPDIRDAAGVRYWWSLHFDDVIKLGVAYLERAMKPKVENGHAKKAAAPATKRGAVRR